MRAEHTGDDELRLWEFLAEHRHERDAAAFSHIGGRRPKGELGTARERLLEKYRCYLREERDLAYGSVRNMLPFVDRFLAQKYPQDHFDFAALKAGDITSFFGSRRRNSVRYRRNIWFHRSAPFSDT